MTGQEKGDLLIQVTV